MTERIIFTNAASAVTPVNPWDFYDQEVAALNARTPDEVASMVAAWTAPTPKEVMQDVKEFQEMFRKFRHAPPAHHPAFQHV